MADGGGSDILQSSPAGVDSSTSVAGQRSLTAAAVVLLGQVIFFGRSGPAPTALICVAGAILLLATAHLLPKVARQGRAARWDGRAAQAFMLVGIVLGFCRLPMLDIYLHVPALRAALQSFILMVALAAPLAAVAATGRPRAIAPFTFPILLVVFALMGAWYIDLSNNPHIDVYLIQRLGCEALVAGRDPFAITFPDIYARSAAYYPPGTVVNGVVQCGYFYPPLSLLLDLPAYAAGDVRYAHLSAIVLAAAMCGYMNPRARGRRRNLTPAVLLLLTPRIFQLLENAWIEPMLLLMLVVALFFALRRRWNIAAIAVGLLLVGKQYVPLASPAILLLSPRPWQVRRLVKLALIAAMAGAIVTLPFFLWSPTAFVHSLTSIYVGILRPDSISFLPILAARSGHRFSLMWTAAAALPAAALVLWRGDRSPAGFAVGAALIWLCVFAFSTQAFGNYYFLVLGALCAALSADAAARSESR